MLARLFRRKRQPDPAPKSADLILFEKRMIAIKRIADEHMKSAQYGGHFPVRDEVLVPWEELLLIWDIADKALHETPVS